MAVTQASRILELRALIAQKEGHILRGRLPSSSLVCGIPKGAITEISGTAKIEWAIQFLKENPSLKVFWAETKFLLLPTAIHQRGVHPGRFIFAECGEDLFVNVRKALRCQVFECIVSPNQYPDEKLLKALQLLAEQTQTSVLLLSETLRPSWPIAVQFEVNRGFEDRGFEIELKKNKGTIS